MKISVVGLGYVGLPLFVELTKHYDNVVGYDISSGRIKELKDGYDRTDEVDPDRLEVINHNNGKDDCNFLFTENPWDMEWSDIFIVTVPTPIDNYKRPNLQPLLHATADIGQLLRKGGLIIYESTVFPSCTEDHCVPILSDLSRLKYNEDFFVGYSPERINPADKVNTLTTITKVVSGSNIEATMRVKELYESLGIKTHVAPNIKVAEMSKAIENAQRDLNISFVNEVALFCSKLDIDTNDVLDAAGTKWNFLKFKAGLVGGHCISVDPYYLIQKAEELDMHLSVIASGRRVNDQMPTHVTSTLIKKMIQERVDVINPRILVMGITFKENTPDIRNSKVIDVVHQLKNEYKCTVDVYDPHADDKLLWGKYQITSHKKLNELPNVSYDAIIYAVDHDEFKEFPFIDFTMHKKRIIYDLKGVLPRSLCKLRL